MGREALVHAEVGDRAGEVRALLESTELILRGSIKRRISRSAIEEPVADRGVLQFRHGEELIRLHLGNRMAQSWMTALLTPPPTLRAKLGLDRGAKALLIGECDDPELGQAIEDAVTRDGSQVAMLIVRVNGPGDLAAALIAHAGYRQSAIWAVYRKGKDVDFGENHVRSALREAGFRDTKSCAVSDRLTATRYSAA